MSKMVTFIADVYPYCVGDTLVLSDEELARVDAVAKARKLKAYVSTADTSAEETTASTPKPPTKKELLAQAAAEGLELEVTDKNTVAEITAAVEAARAAKADAGDGNTEEN